MDEVSILTSVCEGHINRQEAATLMRVSVRTVNRRMKAYNMKRITRAARTAAKKELKARLRALTADMEPEEAASAAGVSVRTIYRWQSQNKKT